jgi:glycine cleavage system regulatory protein
MSNIVNHCQALTIAIKADDQPKVIQECCDLLKNCVPNPQATIQNTRIQSGQSGPQPFDECIKACEEFCNRPQRTAAGPDQIDPNNIVMLVQLVMQVISWFRNRHVNIAAQQPQQTPAQSSSPQQQPPKK